MGGPALKFLGETPPLVGTLGRSELEVAAAVILWGLHELGRDWASQISQREMLALLRISFDEPDHPVHRWFRNPFLSADFDGLVARGFAVSDGGDVLRLTSAALERLGDHLKPVVSGDAA